MSFTISAALDSEKVFVVAKSDATGRWDPFYFRPGLVALEKRVRAATPHRLRDFVIGIAGGATPSTQEAEIHYVEGDGGVPFIRVQNLSLTGRLDLQDCKRITKATHDGLLKRSKLSGGELLIKITGVGRMAVASVVPDNFEANINQHIVAIRTKDRRTGETLAAYLNLDIAERLASRRSTGGTRPALDYPALLSIPVVFDERIPALMDATVASYEDKNAQAANVLDAIDDMLLEELGVAKTAEPPNTVENRMFQRPFSTVTSRRIDPSAHWKQLSLESSKYKLRKLRDVVFINPVTRFAKLAPGTPVSFVPMDAVSDLFGEIVDRQTRPIGESGTYTRFLEGDVLWAKITPCMENGKAALANGLEQKYGFGSTEFHVFRPRTTDLSPLFLHHLLRHRLVREHARLRFTGSSGHQRVDEQFFRGIEIPLPSREEQDRIAEELEATKSKARALMREASDELRKAREEIESLIFAKAPAH